MLYLSCTTINSVDLAHYGVSRVKDWIFVDCGTIMIFTNLITLAFTNYYLNYKFIFQK